MALGLDDVDAVNQLQQVLDLVERSHMLFAGTRQSQLAHTVTRIVQRHLMRERAQTVVHLHHVVQELDNVHAFLGRFADVRLACGGSPATQQPRIVELHERRTADTGCHHIVEVLELLLKLLGQGNGLLLETRIGHRLTTAGLFLGVRHVDTQVLQQLPRRHTYLRIDGIHVTWDK